MHLLTPMKPVDLLYRISFLAYLVTLPGEGQAVNPTTIPPSIQTIDGSYDVVVGAFIFDQSLANSASDFMASSGRKIPGITYTVPFRVDNSLKGTTGEIIHIDLFFPSNELDARNWLLPVKQKLLLFLKKNTDSKTFNLVDPWSSWLVTSDAGNLSANSNPREAVSEEVNAFLKYRISSPDIKIEYFSLSRKEPLVYLQNDPSLIRALKVGQIIEPSNPEFLELAREFISAPGEVGELARTIGTSSGEVQTEVQRLADYSSGKLSDLDKSNFPNELGSEISKSKDLTQIMSLILKGVASPDPEIRLAVARALHTNTTKGKALYPLLIGLLSDSNPQVQYQALGALFDLSGSIKQPPGSRDVDFPAYTIFQKDPKSFLLKCNQWWDEHKKTLN